MTRPSASAAQRSARGRSGAVFAAVLIVTTVGWPGAVRPAFAHEFALALVTPTSGTANDELGGSDVIDGFRLAVDQSPDVSHPEGVDAGDHLGGVDVEVNVIDGSQPTDAAEAVRRQVATGLTAVVVVAPSPTAQAVTNELEGSSVLLLTAAGAGAATQTPTGVLHLTQRTAPTFESGVPADVAAAFKRVHGRELSAAAALGYDAGRLLDVAVARADAGVENLESVVAVASGMTAELVSSEVSTPEKATGERQPAAATNPGADSSPRRLLVAALGTGSLLALGGAVAWRIRRRRDPVV